MPKFVLRVLICHDLGSKRRLAILLAAAVAVPAVILVGVSGAALVKVGTLVLRTDGGFRPQALPARAYAPISFHGYASIESTVAGPPPPLQSVLLDFDRDGRLATAGLSVCPPARIEGTAPAEARRSCGAAAVGTGHVSALVTLPGAGPVEVDSPLTLFNGPRQSGSPTVVLHAQTTYPAPETYVVTVPIQPLASGYSYRATFEVPPIAGGYGAITHVDLKIGKHYRSGGAERSYVSARCTDNVLETHGRFSFADGTIISGTIFKACHARP